MNKDKLVGRPNELQLATRNNNPPTIYVYRVGNRYVSADLLDENINKLKIEVKNYPITIQSRKNKK